MIKEEEWNAYVLQHIEAMRTQFEALSSDMREVSKQMTGVDPSSDWDFEDPNYEAAAEEVADELGLSDSQKSIEAQINATKEQLKRIIFCAELISEASERMFAPQQTGDSKKRARINDGENAVTEAERERMAELARKAEAAVVARRIAAERPEGEGAGGNGREHKPRSMDPRTFTFKARAATKK